MVCWMPKEQSGRTACDCTYLLHDRNVQGSMMDMLAGATERALFRTISVSMLVLSVWMCNMMRTGEHMRRSRLSALGVFWHYHVDANNYCGTSRSHPLK